MSVRAVRKFRLRGRPFSGTMDRAVNSNLEEVQELRNGPNKANFDVFCIRKPRKEHNFIFTKRKLAFLREENDSLLNLVKVPLYGHILKGLIPLTHFLSCSSFHTLTLKSYH